MAYRDVEEEVVTSAEERLAGQLGTEPRKLEKGEHDDFILTNLDDIEVVVNAHFELVPPERGGNYSRKLFKLYRKGKMSIGGLRTRQIVEAIGLSKGVPSTREIDHRSFAERHFTMRNEEKARREGKIYNE